ncbi:para-aminobenzoate synthetase component 1 [Flavobacterium croceum DSM 17960]|uniref:Para-aminobenzoate synthetase component 1 n=1 Tax=Flavobacterium croceum DSM 17960 TaxID=1121886 RepID=A0A2S4NB95_9FLAO|nr:para-aminobenzoate synthetase component 1 [Flavobacterium croceum DSM 17960]
MNHDKKALRTIVTQNIANPKAFKTKLLHWANQFDEVIYLDSNQHKQPYTSYDLVVAVESFTSIQTDYVHAFDDLEQYYNATKDWLFGYLSYDLKNDIEDLKSENFDGLLFPDLYFFQPKKLFLLKENTLELHYLHFCDDELYNDFHEIETYQIHTEDSTPVTMQQRIEKQDYVEKVTKMQHYIQIGDIYEANFCMEFYAENATIQPLFVFEKLNRISQAPFAVYLKNRNKYALSASPERYLKKIQNKIISQPIKGTSKRYEDTLDDLKSKEFLQNSEKEKNENIMIVDLVRNDLSKTAAKNSVEVEELCGVYTFKQVHQMISTVVSTVKDVVSPIEVLKTTFPMGSMTGVPKISAMNIIEQLEETKRGLYSGAVGYFTPYGDFDFNVQIRTILYNEREKYISFSVGSAITQMSNPEQEYEECLVKAQAMLHVLQNP